MKKLAFNYIAFAFMITFSLLLFNCDGLGGGKKLIVRPGSYVFEAPVQSSSVKIESGGQFDGSILNKRTYEVFTYHGTWEQRGSMICFSPFYESVDSSTGADLFPPKKYSELCAEVKDGVLVVYDHIGYWFSLGK